MTAHIPITRGAVALVDDEDLAALSAHKWSLTGCGRYAARRGPRSEGAPYVLMHRALLPEADVVDHINGDGLDNRRSNLRAVTQVENGQNRRGAADRHSTSGARGVSWCTQKGKWRVSAVLRGKQTHGGFFADFDDAVRAATALRNSLFTHNDADRKATT